MTTDEIRQQLRDAGLAKAATDDRLLSWIAGAIKPATTEATFAAIKLLMESPTRAALEHHRYWPWRRRVEAFLATLEG